MKLLNEQKIFDEWAPMLEEETQIKDKEKLSWMSRYCHFHSINESFSAPAAGLLNTPGMGNVTPAGAAAGGASAFYGGNTTGSGDKFPSLLPLSIQVAARTVGFDIVNVIPMNGPSGVLTYMDYVYAGGKGAFGAPPGKKGSANPGVNSYTDKPLVFKIKLPTAQKAAFKAAAVGTEYFFASGASTTAGNVLRVAKIGQSRVDGSAIFRVLGEAAGVVDLTTDFATTATSLNAPQSVSLADVFDATATMALGADGTAVDSNSTVLGSPELVKSLEDHVQGFAGSGPDDTVEWSGDATDGTVAYEPMRRGVGEEQYYRTMGLQAFTKFVEAETFQVAATVTTEQIQDLQRQYGIDLLAMIENALVNDISQSINKHILSRAFALGWSHNLNFLDVEGANLNLDLIYTGTGATATKAYITKDGTGVAGVFAPFQAYLSAATATSAENQGTFQRRVYSKLLAGGNVITQRGRRGPANFVVTNLQLATALQDSAQFAAYPMANTINQNNGSLYPVGTVAGMTVYVDPNMTFSDNRMLIGRKGADEEPGLKFMPYLMAENIQTIAEGTMAPKIAVKSRYALVEAGHHPETMYFTIAVNVPTGGLV